jgi:hypothetical protein
MAAGGGAVPNRGFLRAVQVYLVVLLGATLLVGVEAIVVAVRGVTNETTGIPFVALVGFLISPVWVGLLNGVRARLAGHPNTALVSTDLVGRSIRMALGVPMLLYGTISVVSIFRFGTSTAKAWGGAIALLTVGTAILLGGRRRRIAPT